MKMTSSNGARDRYYVTRASIVNAAIFSLSAILYLCIIFAVEIRYPGQYVFSSNDQWRLPFLYLCVFVWAVLASGLLAHCCARILAKRKGYVLSLSPAARPAVVFSLLWVAGGLAGAVAGGIFVTLGMRQRASSSSSNDVLRAWILPIISGVVPAIIYFLMMLSCIIASFRAIRSVKLERSSRNIRDAEEAVVENDGEDTDLGARPFDNVTDTDLDTNGTPVISRPPPYNPAAFQREPTKEEVDEMLDTLRGMGFPNSSQNFAALQASNYDVHNATQRLLNVQQFR